MSKSNGPSPSEQIGCFLLLASSIATGLLGIMAVGALVPVFAVIAFQVAAVALVASIALTSLMGFFAFLRRQDEKQWHLRGENLDRLGESCGVKRMFAEPDHRYRERISKAMRGDRS